MPQKSKNFVCNIENMQQLVNLCTHAGVRWWLRSEQLFWAKEGDAFQISPEQEGQLTIPELKSNQQKQIPEWFYTAIMLPNRDISTLETEALKVIASYFFVSCWQYSNNHSVCYPSHGNKKPLNNITRLSHHYTHKMRQCLDYMYWHVIPLAPLKSLASANLWSCCWNHQHTAIHLGGYEMTGR